VASVAQIGRRPLTREEHALVESVKTPMRKLAAKVARRCRSSDMADDLFQTAMAHVAYLTPDYRPEQGASFLTFVFWPVRDVLDESLKAELRDKAYAAAAERGLRVVMDVIELGDVLNESETQRRERMTTAR
jgi:DNA-directed RNA polymerase specialized sigma24 family protein